jgi:hypothetical protein
VAIIGRKWDPFDITLMCDCVKRPFDGRSCGNNPLHLQVDLGVLRIELKSSEESGKMAYLWK